jgi:hypothetical protein
VSYCTCNTVRNLSFSLLIHILTSEIVTEMRVDWNRSACRLPVVVGVSSPCFFGYLRVVRVNLNCTHVAQYRYYAMTERRENLGSFPAEGRDYCPAWLVTAGSGAFKQPDQWVRGGGGVFSRK